MPPDSAVPLSKPRPQHDVGLAVEDRLDHLRHQRRVVLVVRVDHDHDVGLVTQRFEIARLLVAAVAAILQVDDHFQAQPLGDVDGIVVRDVVDQDHLVDDVHGQAAIGRLERARGVVGGHDDHNAGAVFHGAMIVGRCSPGRCCLPSLDCTRHS